MIYLSYKDFNGIEKVTEEIPEYDEFDIEATTPEKHPLQIGRPEYAGIFPGGAVAADLY